MSSAAVKIPRRLRNCHNIEDIHQLCRRTLPFPIYDYLAGGADDEVTLRDNIRAYEKYALIPRYCREVDLYSTAVDMSTTVLGQKLDWPFLPSPSGGQGMFHPDGEIGVARAAHRAGTAYSISNYAFTSMEDVAAAAPEGAKFFQLPPCRSREMITGLMDRAKAAGYKALILTVDNPTHGNRERDARSGFGLQPRFGLKSLLSFAYHPRWAFNVFRNPPELAMFKDYLSKPGNDMTSLDRELTYSPSWEEVASWIEYWGGHFAIKGLMSVEDMRLATDAGASAVVVSNQGARHFDYSPATFDMLTDVLDTVGDQVEVILDGGIRRGTDILKGIALGAKACMAARPHYYGLAAAGQAGVSRVFELLKAEVKRDMIFLGARTLKDVSRECLRRRS